MHDTDPTDLQPAKLRSAAADPLKGAPPPGMWAIWHGPQAKAVVLHAQHLGRLATPADHAAAPPRPAELAAPVGLSTVAHVVEAEGGGRWLVQEDRNGLYVSAYLCGLGGQWGTAPAPRGLCAVRKFAAAASDAGGTGGDGSGVRGAVQGRGRGADEGRAGEPWGGFRPRVEG